MWVSGEGFVKWLMGRLRGRSMGANQGAGWFWYHWRKDWERFHISWVVTGARFEDYLWSIVILGISSPSKIDSSSRVILVLESLLYDNSSPRPPKAFQDNSNTIIESLPIFPIPVKDSDSLREEIDIFPCPDDSIPPGIESDDFDSEGDYHHDVVEDTPVMLPNILPTIPSIHMDFVFILLMISESDHDVSSSLRR
ncbi:hypothetical protein Tco_1447931 [Tanacetum coccineum]